MNVQFYRDFVGACCLAVVLANTALGQGRGDQVVVVKKDATLDVPGQGATVVEPGTILDVRAERGNWLRVVQQNGGWIPKSAVTPLPEADAFLTKRTSEATAEFEDFHALAQLRGERQGWQQAAEVYDSALKTFPDSALAFFHRGMVHSKLGKTKEAIADYEKAISLDPKMVAAINNLAWIRATGETEFRDGAKALELASQAQEITKGLDSSVLDTLAAANAELGRFADAAKWQIAAIRLKGRGAASDPLYLRLKLYSTKQAYRAKTQ
jgi:tetratricopeptide (TPR) repeat protein